MSNLDVGPLATYTSLCDPHLTGYFSNTKKKKHLRKMGLVTRRGEIVSEATYRVNMARKEHQKHVRDLLAQAIVHKTLDTERTRQVEIKQKIEEIAKIELVRRVRADTDRKGDEEVLPYLSPCPTKNTKKRPTSVPAGKKRKSAARPISAPSKGHNDDLATVYVDEDGYPISPRVESSKAGRRKKKSPYPTDDIDDRHLQSLDQTALLDYYRLMSSVERGRIGPSPYTEIPAGLDLKDVKPHPPGKGGKIRFQFPPKHTSMKGQLMLHRAEPAMKHQERVQTLCDVTMHYFGSSLHLDYEKFDPTDDIVVEQQHCGGNTLIVFKERILPHSDFTFTSRRHRGYPFSLTFSINGVLDCRLSTCCEYKHQRGARIGGRTGHFALVVVEGALPCYKCLVYASMREKKPKKRKEEVEEEEVDKETQVAVETDPENKEVEEKVDVVGMKDDEDVPPRKPMAAIEEESNYSDAGFDKESKYSDDEKGSSRSDGSGHSRSSSRSGSKSRSSSASSKSSRSRSSSGSRSRSPSPKPDKPRTRSPEPTKDTHKDKEKKPKADTKKSAKKDSSKKKRKKEKKAERRDSDQKIDGVQSKNTPDESAKEKDAASDSDRSHQSSRRSSKSSDSSHDQRPKTRMDKRTSETMDDLRSQPQQEKHGSDSSEDDRPKSRTEMRSSDTPEEEKNENSVETDQEHDTSKNTSNSTSDSKNDTLQAVQDEMKKVLTTPENDKADSSDDERKSVKSSSSSDSASETEREGTTKSGKGKSSETDDTGGVTGTETDRAGGHDPDRVAHPGTTTPSHLSLIGIEPGAKHDGSLRPLLENKAEFDLTSIALSDEQVEELASLIKEEAVESLILRNSNITNDGLRKITEALKQTSPTDLKMLNLNCNNIDEEGMVHVVDILECKTELEILLLHGSQIGDEGIRTLVAGLLEIHESGQVPDEHIAAIADATRNIVSDVIHHSLRDNRSRRTSMDVLNAAFNETLVPSGLHLKHLDIGDCHMTDEGACQIASLISNNTPISNISLTGNKSVSSVGWEAIANALKVNKHIKTLSLDYNSLGDHGASVVAEAIKENNKLQSLDLEGNQITDVGADKLLEGMRLNRSINDITLMPGNSIKETTLIGIKELLASRSN